MKRRLIYISIFAIIICFGGCKKMLYNEIECRNYIFPEDLFWFPNNVGDTISFTSSSKSEKKFVIDEKLIQHTTKYVENTGCGCEDNTSILLRNETDSIWFRNTLFYIYDNKEDVTFYVVFNFSGKHSAFNIKDKSIAATLTIDNIIFNDVQKLEFNYSDPLKVKTAYLVKNLGIIKFEQGNGEYWINRNLIKYLTDKQESYEYIEGFCD